VVIHIAKLESFGVSYIRPAVPNANGFSDLKDFMVRVPLMMMKKRPVMLKPQDQVRKGRKD
jgi:spore germination protein